MWSPEFALVPEPDHYHGERAAFGHAVGLGAGGQVAAVGAPYSENHGVVERQNVSCVARGGTFRLGLFGFYTLDVPWNASTKELEAALRGRVLAPMIGAHPSPTLIVDGPSHQSSVCGNGTNASAVLITFVTPPTGPGFATSRADLPLLDVDSSKCVDCHIKVAEVRKGTAQPLGEGARGENAGAAFVFRRYAVDATKYPASGAWSQVARLSDDDGGAPGDRFGWALDVLESPYGETLVAVGAPYAGASDAGAVFVFADLGSGWIKGPAPLDASVYGQAQGDEFGFSVKLGMSGGRVTLLVGAPGEASNRGAVYVFSADSLYGAATAGLSLSQRLTADDGPSLMSGTRTPGDRFGCSVGVDADDAVVGACGAADVPRRGTAAPERDGVARRAGAVIAFSRPSSQAAYAFAERVVATNVGRGDRFGQTVAVANGTLLATAVSDLNGAFDRGDAHGAGLLPQRAVWQIKTTRRCGPPPLDGNWPDAPAPGPTKYKPCALGGRFRVGWRTTNASRVAALCEDDDTGYAPLGKRVCEGVSRVLVNQTEGARHRWTSSLDKRASYRGGVELSVPAK